MEAGEVLRACRGKFNQAIDLPSGLGEPRPQRVDRILLRAIRFEPLAQALAQHLAIEDALEPLVDAVEDGVVEIGHEHAEPIADAEWG